MLAAEDAATAGGGSAGVGGFRVLSLTKETHRDIISPASI
jgi:hypothetical protein